MEASNGAHYWAKTLSEFGHDVRLISPQFVTPYVKSNKNDRNDDAAWKVCEKWRNAQAVVNAVKMEDYLAR